MGDQTFLTALLNFLQSIIQVTLFPGLVAFRSLLDLIAALFNP